MLVRLAGLLLVRRDELRQVGFFFLLMITVGAGMALGRGTTDALFFKRYGIEYLPVMYALVSLFLAAISLLYAAFVDLIPPERFFKILFLVLGGLLAASWEVMVRDGSDLVYPAYFLIYEVASELLLVHGALYLGQNLVQTPSKRLMPIILAGHQIGVILGGLVLALLAPTIGVHNMLLGWSLCLVLSLVLIVGWHARYGVSPYFRAGRKERSRLRQSVTQVTQGMRLMGSSSLLKMSSAALFFMVISTYVLCYTVNRIYSDTFATEESLSAFFGMLTAATSTTALVLQVLVTNRVIRRFGVKNVNLLFPTTSFLSFAALLLSFGLPAAVLASFNKDALMPAFRNPVRNIFMDALPGHIQGRARAMSIVIVIPLALLAAGFFLWAAQRVEHRFQLPLLGMLAASAYLFFNRLMNAAYLREIVTNLRKRLFVPSQQLRDLVRGHDEQVLQDLERGVMHEDDSISLAYSRVLALSSPGRAAELLPRRMQQADAPTRDEFVRMLRPLQSGELRDRLRNHLGTDDRQLDAGIFLALFESRDEEVRDWVPLLLEHETGRLRTAGVYGALHYPIPILQQRALDVWAELLADPRLDQALLGVELIQPELEPFFVREPVRSACRRHIAEMLQSPDGHTVRSALNALKRWPSSVSLPELTEPLLDLCHSPDWTVRHACLRCTHLLPAAEREDLLTGAIEDTHPRVRSTAVTTLAEGEPDRVGFLCRCLVESQLGSPKAQEAMIDCLIEAGAPAETMLRVSLAKARDAHRMVVARATLAGCAPPDAQGTQLLAHALGERMTQLVDLALLALQSSDCDENIAVIRAGLQSGDQRQFADACELLSHLSHKELARSLLELFDGAATQSEPASVAPEMRCLEGLFEWGRTRLDPWLRDCVSYASSHLGAPRT